jgi:hypothetical protein
MFRFSRGDNLAAVGLPGGTDDFGLSRAYLLDYQLEPGNGNKQAGFLPGSERACYDAGKGERYYAGMNDAHPDGSKYYACRGTVVE